MRYWYFFMPYCLKRLKSGNWIFLNRRYKPLGVKSYEYVDYDASPTMFKMGGVPIKSLKAYAVLVIEYPDEALYYFYRSRAAPDSSPQASAEYYKRIEKVMQLFTKEDR